MFAYSFDNYNYCCDQNTFGQMASSNIITTMQAQFGSLMSSIAVNLHLVSVGLRELYMIDQGLSHPTLYPWLSANAPKYNLIGFSDHKGNIFVTNKSNLSHIPEIKARIQSKQELGKMLGYYCPTDVTNNFNYSMQVMFTDPTTGCQQLLFTQGSNIPFDPMYMQALESKFNSISSNTGIYFRTQTSVIPFHKKFCPCPNCN